MKSQTTKTILKVIAYDLIFLVIWRLALIAIPHNPYPIIYHVNINFHFLIACLIWFNLTKSKINRTILIVLGIWPTLYVPQLIIYLLISQSSIEFLDWYMYHLLCIYVASYQLYITMYLFIISLYPTVNRKTSLLWSIILTSTISLIIYLPIFISGQYETSLGPIFYRTYYMNLINFSLLVVFWHQYTRTKLIFSEYLSNILSVYSVLIGLAILHDFSFENDLLFAYFAQYFNSILYSIINVLLIARLNYLDKPDSKENEEYIENYYLLQGFVDKPRKGLLVTFYSSMNKTMLIIAIVLMIFLGIYLFSYDKFEVFVKLNILILILAFIVAAILAIVTWHKRWYDAMGFLFKKQKSN